jgi:hypothetical protein
MLYVVVGRSWTWSIATSPEKAAKAYPGRSVGRVNINLDLDFTRLELDYWGFRLKRVILFAGYGIQHTMRPMPTGASHPRRKDKNFQNE